MEQFLPVSAQSIATSQAQNDSGMSELNFRDEWYLPFEGYGAVSEWQLELSGKWVKQSEENGQPEIVNMSQFDFDTLSDVILHLRYTDRDGGETLKTAARTALTDALETTDMYPQYCLLSLRHEFPNEWHLMQQNGLNLNLRA